MAGNNSFFPSALVFSSLLCLFSQVVSGNSAEEKTKLYKDGGISPLVPTSFCLLTDREFHINMLLSGYVVNMPSPDVKPVRSWIRELSFFWVKNGKAHSVVLSARRGPAQERGDGFLQSITVDGTVLPHLTLGDEASLFEGDAAVSFEAYEKAGNFDVDVYRVQIEGLFEGEVRLRIATPALQEVNDAEVHMNLDILDVEHTPAIHGVIGQSYQESSSEQSLDYSALGSLMASMSSGLSSGDANLEEAHKFFSTSVMSADCAVSQFSFKLKDALRSGVSVA